MLYLDPSKTNSSEARDNLCNWKYLGCFGNGALGAPFFERYLRTHNTMECMAYCGYLKYQFISRNGTDADGRITCGCGTNIASGYQLSESSCSLSCDGATGGA